MTDERLRDSERRWRATRSLEDGQLYARELERRGERTRLHSVLCELARSGDEGARERVRRWRPGGSLGAHVPLTSGSRTRFVVLDVPESPIHYGVKALNEEVVVVWTGGPADRLVGHRLDDLERLWQIPRRGSRLLGVSGDRLLFFEEQKLRARSVQGEVVAEAEIPGIREHVDTSYQAGTVRIRDDRAYFTEMRGRNARGGPSTLIIAADLGAELGRELWRIERSAEVALRLAEDELALLRPFEPRPPYRVDAVDPITGLERWTASLDVPYVLNSIEVVGSGEYGGRALVFLMIERDRRPYRRAGPQQTRLQEIAALDARTGAQVWLAPVPRTENPWHYAVVGPVVVASGWLVGCPAAGLSPEDGSRLWTSTFRAAGRVEPRAEDELVAFESRPARIDVVALDAASGAERWRTAISGPPDSVDETRRVEGDVAYVAHAGEKGRITLAGVDLRDGRVRFESAVEVGAFPIRNTYDSNMWLEILEREVVVVVQQQGRLALARFADPG